MGISIALSPTQGNPAFSKDAITNASFRARRLPGKCVSANIKDCYFQYLGVMHLALSIFNVQLLIKKLKLSRVV